MLNNLFVVSESGSETAVVAVKKKVSPALNLAAKRRRKGRSLVKRQAATKETRCRTFRSDLE